MRRLVRQTQLSVDDLVYPMFVSQVVTKPTPIESMPGINNHPVDDAIHEAERAFELGIPAVLLFGTPEHKDPTGSASWSQNGIIQQAVEAIKEAVPDLVVITDVCLCEYTDHGHCGVISGKDVDNDATLDLLARQAVSHAEAGADMVAPSDMMDGRVAAIRKALDKASFESIPIMSYAAKFCSAFYGPFREAVDSAPRFGDRRTYQMDPPNAREALREVRLDFEEGADIVMVKPALAYLDIISAARRECDLPVAAYNVSGEYAMVKLSAQAGQADEKRLAMEVLTSIKRAGADIIITYHACDAAQWLNEQGE
jgi:porphobilinogen synthase